MMKNLLKSIFVVAALGAALVQAEPANKKCPVSGRDVDPSVSSKYTVVLGFCCEKCQAKFKENPADEKFAAAVKAAAGKPVNSICPVSGEDIDASKTAVHEGQTVAFCCGKCCKKFVDDPSKFAAKVKADHCANDKCPVSGKEVDADTATVHTAEVGFCCEKCQAKFEKDPAAVLNKG